MALYLWATFSFLSNSALSLQHIAISIGIILSLKKTFSFKVFSFQNGKSFWMLFLLFVFCVISILSNWGELVNPLWNLKKCKYPLLASLLYALSFEYRKDIKKHLFQILVIFLLSFSVANLYGIIKYFIDRSNIEDAYDLRLSGFFGMILSYSYTAVIPLLLALHLLINKNLRQLAKANTQGTLFHIFFSQKLLIAMAATGTLALYLSFSRGPLVGLFLTLPLLFLKHERNMFLKIITITGLIVVSMSVYTLLSGSQKNRLFQSAYNNSNAQRVSQAKMAFEAFKEKPIFGQGYRSLEERDLKIKQKHGINHKDFNGHAHNNHLEILATTGTLGFIAYFMWLFFWLKEILKAKSSPWYLFLISLLVYFVISGLAQSSIIDSEFSFTFYTFFGLTPLLL